MITNKEKWRDLEKDNPELFRDLLTFFRKLMLVSEDIQMEMSLHLLKDEEFSNKLKEFNNKPEEKIMEFIDNQVKVFVSMIPFALSNGVNPIMTILGAHSAVTGDPLIDSLIKKLNEENLEEKNI
jgi:hypothetical protein